MENETKEFEINEVMRIEINEVIKEIDSRIESLNKKRNSFGVIYINQCVLTGKIYELDSLRKYFKTLTKEGS